MGNDAQPSTSAMPESMDDASTAIPGLTGELIINRQRDLLDRGLINVLIHNHTGHDIGITDRQLFAEHFETRPAAPRISKITDGRDAALQVPYGTPANCDSDAAVDAALDFVYTLDGDPELQMAAITLGGTDILDVIRARQCAAMTFDDSTTTSLRDVQVVDGTVTATLGIDNTGTHTFAIELTSGTILVGAQTTDVTPITIPPGESAEIHLTFVVNRCDPHAMAEVTKRYGLDLGVAINGAAPLTVAIDITSLISQLEDIVEQCRASFE